MRINQPGQHKRAMHVDGFGALELDVLDIRILPDRDDFVVCDCNRGRARLLAIYGVNIGVIQNAVHFQKLYGQTHLTRNIRSV